MVHNPVCCHPHSGPEVLQFQGKCCVVSLISGRGKITCETHHSVCLMAGVGSGILQHLLCKCPRNPMGLQPILNLKPFNCFVRRVGFKLDSNDIHLRKMVMAIDLKDTYCHIPVSLRYRKLLRVLPFSLSSSSLQTF